MTLILDLIFIVMYRDINRCENPTRKLQSNNT